MLFVWALSFIGESWGILAEDSGGPIDLPERCKYVFLKNNNYCVYLERKNSQNNN